jgi:putative ABC transport system permease protein
MIRRGRNFFTSRSRSACRHCPGIERAGGVSRLPLSGGNSSRTFNLSGSEAEFHADNRTCTPDYFRAMGIPLLEGRVFSEHDVTGSLPVAIINEALARAVFRGEDPIGKAIVNFGTDNETLQIVGVVGNVRHDSLETSPRGEIYQPAAQATWPRMFFTVKSAATNPLNLASMAQHAVSQVDPNVALGNVRTMQDAIAKSVTTRKFAMLLLATFAGIAVALAAIGLYGVMSYSVSQRTREIGIRMAVGAQRKDVLKLIVRQGMFVTAIGVGAGLCASFGLTRLMAALLYGISPTDSFTFVFLSLLLFVIALLACFFPARRASGVDPMVALRTE